MNNIIIEEINENRKKKVNEVSALAIIDLLFCSGLPKLSS